MFILNFVAENVPHFLRFLGYLILLSLKQVSVQSIFEFSEKENNIFLIVFISKLLTLQTNTRAHKEFNVFICVTYINQKQETEIKPVKGS